MRLPIVFAIILSAPAPLAGAGFDLQPGKPFPKIPLPLADGSGLQDITAFRGEKLMLHLFASW